MFGQSDEYASLRQEIISIEEKQRNVWIYMYVLFCSLFVLGLEWSHYLFLVTYIILIPFQCVINDFIWCMSKVSTYIQVFYEDENDNLNWESFHTYYPYIDLSTKKKKSFVEIISITSSVHLGFLATSFFCAYILKNAYTRGYFLINILDGLLILFSVILFFVILIINKEYNKKYFNEKKVVMNSYKKYIEEKAEKCDFCQSGDSLGWEDGKNKFFVNNKGEMFVTVNDVEMKYKIKYCPNCGKKFK